jgi:hypothetical protein
MYALVLVPTKPVPAVKPIGVRITAECLSWKVTTALKTESSKVDVGVVMIPSAASTVVKVETLMPVSPFCKSTGIAEQTALPGAGVVVVVVVGEQI